MAIAELLAAQGGGGDKSLLTFPYSNQEIAGINWSPATKHVTFSLTKNVDV